MAEASNLGVATTDLDPLRWRTLQLASMSASVSSNSIRLLSDSEVGMRHTVQVGVLL